MIENVKSSERYAGFYLAMNFAVEVVQEGDELLLTIPDAPAGFEVLLHPHEPHVFRMETGPLQGALARFELDESAQVSALYLGAYKMQPVTEVEARAASPRRVPAPPLDLDGEKEAAFAQLWQQVLATANGRFIDYRLPYPKHEFLRYVSQQDAVVFHGSANGEIDEFRPLRTSVEIGANSENGNIQGIYATHDALWPIFFAVLNRKKLRGHISNGFMDLQNRAGETMSLYHFSVNQAQIDDDIWHEGTLYLLPRDTFRQLGYEGGSTNEWVSEVAVKPLAKIKMSPDDFPFLEDVTGHDDTALIRLEDLSKAVYDRVVTAGLADDDGVKMALDWDEELAAQLIEFIELLRQFMPTVAITMQFEADDGAVWLTLQGQPAFVQVLRSSLEKRDVWHE